MKRCILPILATVSLLVGCTKEQLLEQEAVQGDLIPICVNSSIRQEATKATADGFVGGDAVGLFAVNYINDNAQAGTLVTEGNQADNVKYVFDETNHKWVPVKSVYYKDINTHADLYLYYPYQKSISDVNAAGFEVQKDQSAAATETSLSGYEASDFLWGKGEDITPSQSAVNIKLSHMMASVKVTLVEGDGFGDGEFESLEKSIILTNTTRKATINYASGDIAPLGGSQMDGIVMCPQSDGTWRAIAVPQSVADGTQLFAITVNGMSYYFKQGNATEFQSGKQTNFTITVKKKTLSGDLEFTLTSAQITDWTEDLNTHGGEARQYFVVNVERPGMLYGAIKALRKDPHKIKNLKVCGPICHDDFKFIEMEMPDIEAVNLKEAELKGMYSCDEANLLYRLSEFGHYDYEIEEPYSEYKYYWYSPEGDGIIPSYSFFNKKSLTHFVFPEYVRNIQPRSFTNTSLSGPLILPEGLEEISGDEYTYYVGAFEGTKISSVSFPSTMKKIGRDAFHGCQYLTGQLVLPDSIEEIQEYAFCGCKFNSGPLVLPRHLKFFGRSAFQDSGDFYGDLEIPDEIREIPSSVFSYTKFHGGKLDLNNVISIGGSAFDDCNLSGELAIPDGNKVVEGHSFSNNNFSFVKLPSTIISIEGYAFANNLALEGIIIQDGVKVIGDGAFIDCGNLLSIEFPQSIQLIGEHAFENCFYISRIISYAKEPPTVMPGAFDGVAKDNFVLEVPEQSIVRYQTEVGWSDFKRITAHYDFSIGRTRMRALNAGMERTYTLLCPAGNNWSISDKPDWITVLPSSGTGKTDVTITVSEMPRTDAQFEVNTGSFQYPSYTNYRGRKDTVVFTLSGKDYTCKLEVEQYDYGKADGEVITHQTHTTAKGIDIVFIGEGYDARDIADGKFETDCENGYKHFFAIEPYKTYKDYFNVYSVVSQSDESGIETVNTIIANKFMKNGVRDVNAALSWAKKARTDIDLTRTVVILLDNSKDYYGWTNMYGDGSAMSVVPISEEAYPYDFRGLIQHEAGGHAFGKLGDEYIYHNSYITSCGCPCCDHPSYELDLGSQFGLFKSKGWFKNLSMNSDHNQVPWSHLLYNPKYSNRVDMYEGAYMHMRGMYRSEITSCMNNNIPYFSSISRQAIVERLKEYAGETFDFDEFVAKDNFDVGTKSSVQNFDWTFGVDPKWNRGTEKGSIIYMGEHPNVK